MENQGIIPNLFRTEFSKISSVLSRHFGVENIEIAEDLASDTFLTALETWPYKGIPENPEAWLYTVAKNKTKNYLQRNSRFHNAILPQIAIRTDAIAEPDFSEQNINDSLLQMLFTICHPSISTESQIGLALRILCGFGIEEIATAFLTNKETINKRLHRAKLVLRQEKISISLPAPAEIESRLNQVLATIYLMFSEGYYSESREETLQEELCQQAMGLARMLIENNRTNLPSVNALYALMCFHSSRFAARKQNPGELRLYHEQDTALWNRELISEGAWHLRLASVGNSISRYHLEAGIAYWYTVGEDSEEKWDNILQLYDKLLNLHSSPIIALNRAYALFKVHGPQQAIDELGRLNLTSNHFYHMLLGELYLDIDKDIAQACFQKARALTKSESEKRLIDKRCAQLRNAGDVR